MTQNRFKVAGLGELIWDLLPDGKQLGGAPSNFAYISSVLGNNSLIASRVGDDDPGREAIKAVRERGIDADYIQLDATHPTGTVGVTIGSHGEPNFEVNQNSAWDYLEFTPQWSELANTLDAVCFGTLGQRRPEARATMKQFLEATRPQCLRIFDVNLRHSFFTRQMLEESLRLSTIVKLNSEELWQLDSLLGDPQGNSLKFARKLIHSFDLELVAITRGAKGSLLISQTRAVEHHGFNVPVIDTIGAGDAFAAAVVHYYLNGEPLNAISAAANKMGALVTTQPGATSLFEGESLEQLLRKDFPLNLNL